MYMFPLNVTVESMDAISFPCSFVRCSLCRKCVKLKHLHSLNTDRTNVYKN